MKPRPPFVYLIHRGEDKPAARLLAESLLDRGIDVWFDEWEIVGGDLVVGKMEQGLATCDGAIVFLSEHGVGKRWASEEYEAMLAMISSALPDRPKPFLIPVVHGNAPDLPPFLKSRQQRASSDIAGITDSIYKHLGFTTSDKPTLGKLRLPQGPLEILLELDREGDDVIARWGEHECRARLPRIEESRIREAIRGNRVTRDGGTRLPHDATHLDAIGRRLAAALSGDLGAALGDAVAEASAERRVLLRLHATHRGAGLLALPWEAATLPGHVAPLGIAARTALVREVVPERPTLVHAIDGPLRVLVVVAAPDDDLDTAAELGVFLDGLERAHVGRARLAFVDAAAATLDGIREALDTEPFHVVHISAHGEPDRLLFEGHDGGTQPVRAEELADVLVRAEHPPALVVLSACSTGAAASEADRLHFAEVLVRRGVPQVIAMQGPIGDGYATELARYFYQELALGSAPSAARALGRARAIVEYERQAAARSRNHDYRAPAPEYATPTFYASTTVAEATLFDATRAWQTVEPPPRLGLIEGLAVRSAEALVGRRRLQRQIQQTLIEKGGVLLWGMGGTGKSSLAASVAERLLRHGWGVAVVVGAHSISDIASAVVEQVGKQVRFASGEKRGGGLSDNVGERLLALAMPGKEEKTILARLCDLLEHERVLILLDNFEDNLSRGDDRLPTSLADTSIRRARLPAGHKETLGDLLDHAGRGALLLTCRYPLADLQEELAEIAVGPLEEPAIRQLVWRLEGLRGLKQDDLRPVLRTLGGHPRILEFADALIRVERHYDGIIDMRGHKRRFNEVQEQISALAEVGRFELRDAYDDPPTTTEVVADARRLATADVLLSALLGTLDPPTARFLGAIAVYRRPVPREALDAVADTLDPAIDTWQRTEAIRRLSGRTLLSGPPRGPWVVHRWTAAEIAGQFGDPKPAHRAAARWWLDAKNAWTEWERGLEAVEHQIMADDIEDASQLARGMVEAAKGRGASLAARALIDRMLEAAPPGSRLRCAWFNESVGLLLTLGDTAQAHSQAREALALAEGLAKVHPHSVQAQRDLSASLTKLGDVEVAVGNLQAARDFVTRSLEVQERLAMDPNSAQVQHDLAITLNKLGDVEVAAGNLQAARALYSRSFAVTERCANANPHLAQAQRDLSSSCNELGDVEVAAGNLQTARALFSRSLEIRKRLARADEKKAEAQRDLSISYNKLGDVEVAAGNLQAARDLFAHALEVRNRLAEADEYNAQAQRDLSISCNKLGDVEVAAGNLQAARDLFARSLELRERLANVDLYSAQAQRDLSVSLERLGDVALAAGNLQAARDHFARSLDVRERLANVDRDSAQAQRDLSVSLARLRDVEVATGNLLAARGLFARSLEVRERLAKADDSSAQAQRDLSVSYNEMGDVEAAAGNLQAARELFARALEIRERLAKGEYSAQAQRDLSICYNKLGDVEMVAGNLETAHDLFTRYLVIAKRLSNSDPHNAQAQRDLSISYNKVGDVEEAAGNLEMAQDLFARSLKIRERLAKDQHSAQAQRDLCISYERMAKVDQVNAATWLGKAVDLRRKHRLTDPTNAIVARELAITLYALGRVEIQQGQAEEASSHLSQAHQILEWLREIGALEARSVRIADKLAQTLGQRSG